MYDILYHPNFSAIWQKIQTRVRNIEISSKCNKKWERSTIGSWKMLFLEVEMNLSFGVKTIAYALSLSPSGKRLYEI